MQNNNVYHQLFKLVPLPTVLLSVHDHVIVIEDYNEAFQTLIKNEISPKLKEFYAWLETVSATSFYHTNALVIETSLRHSLKTKKISRAELENGFQIEHTPLLDISGNIEFVMQVLTPIEHLKTVDTSLVTQAAEGLERELPPEELAVIFENISEVVFVISVESGGDFKFKAANKAFQKQSNLSLKSILGKRIEEIIPEPLLSSILSKYKLAIKNKQSLSWEHRASNQQSNLTAIISVTPIFNSEGVCTQLIGTVYDITERLNAEHEKQQAKGSLAKIMDLSLDVLCTIDEKGKFVAVSAAACRIWGYSVEALIGKSYLDLVHPDDIALTKALAQQVVVGLEATSFENRNIKKDGTVIHMIWSARWEPTEAMMYCTAKDATDRIQAEKKLQESEQRFKSLVQEGSDMIAILDPAGNYLYVSPTSIAVLGMELADFANLNVSELVHPDDAEYVISNFNKVGIEKRVALKPFRFKHKNGTWRWIETVATDLLDEPSIKGIVTNSRDVSEKIHAQKEIALSNERYALVSRATSDAIWDWDMSTNELYWGDGFKHLFGYQPRQLTGNLSDWYSKIHPNDLERIGTSMDGVIQSNESNWEGEYLYLKANGDYTYVLDKGFVIRDEQGKAVRMVGAMQDISQRKKEEQQLKLLESVITQTNDSVVITEVEVLEDGEPRILYVNEAFINLTGYAYDEVIGKTPHIFQGPKTDQTVLKQIKEHVKNHQSFETTLINYKKSGEEFWKHISITPVADEKGRFTHWISIERDVTAQKNKESQKVLLAEISQLFNTPHSLTDTLQKLLKLMCAKGNYCAAEIWMLDKEKEQLTLASKYADDEKAQLFYNQTRNYTTADLGMGLPGTVWQNKTLQVWDIATLDTTKFRSKAALLAGMKKAVGVPLFSNEKLNGVFILGTREDGNINALFSKKFGAHLGAELKRKQLEQELNQLFTFAPDIIAIINFDGYFKKLNPAACSLLEYTLDEFLARPIIEFIHPDDKQGTIDQFSSHKDRTETYGFECRFITKSGRIKWLNWSSNTLLEEGLIFSVAKDITDKKNLTNLLHKSNNLGKVGSWEIDLLSESVYWSDNTHEIRETDLGFTPNIDSGIHYFKENSDKDTLTKKISDCKLYGIPWDEEIQIITLKGNLKWIRTMGQAEMVNGKCIRMYGSLQDIDERKKAELNVQHAIQKLEESEKRYSELFHLSPLPKWVYDMDTFRFLDVNQAAIKNYGYSYEEFMNMTIQDIRPEEELPSLTNAIRESRNNGGHYFEGLFVHKHKNGDKLSVEVKSNTISFKGRKAKVIVANDITERIRYFHALEQQNKKLQEISWIQSHVIRAPLSRLIGLVYLLKNKDGKTEISEESILTYIEESAEELDIKIKEIIEKSDTKEL